MTLHELFLMFRKAGESHRMVMLNQLFFWQGVDSLLMAKFASSMDCRIDVQW
jgi:hypothetical protein